MYIYVSSSLVHIEENWHMHINEKNQTKTCVTVLWKRAYNKKINNKNK